MTDKQQTTKYKHVTLDGLEKTLKSHKNITDVGFINVDDHGFSRTLQFTVFEKQYKIVWFHNASTLFIDNIEVPFEWVEISGTWPSKAKTNIQFYIKAEKDFLGRRDCVCILPIEYYKEESLCQ